MSTLLELPARTPTAKPSVNPGSATGGRRLRMLVVTDTDLVLRGGSERFLTHLLEGLDPDRFSVDVVQLDRGDSTCGLQAIPISRSNIRLEYRPVRAIYGLAAWKVWRELRARVSRGDYDLVQSQHEKSDLLCALLPSGPLRISNRRDTGFQKGLMLRLLFVLLNHRFDLVIAPARAILTQLVEHAGIDQEQTHCLPNGVDCEHFLPWSGDEHCARRQAHALPPQQYLFGCAARMVPVKRHRDLIDAFAQVASVHPQAGLVLIGRGPLEAELRARVAGYGLTDRVVFHGEEADMASLLPLLDAFVMASSSEGLSNAIIEAMACGLPTIATAVGGNTELVEAGLNGFLVPPSAPDQIALAMGEFLTRPDLGRTMGRHARTRAVEQFSLPGMIAGYSSFYQSLQPEIG
ncbi:glycosyltransferase family 4 protein [Wenzhouxiangella sp. AB-CW3]|uniref:glycosyltransferase family 4 protein n=1 Tax=Wenzhouxiangella sp. AB-CW3 TaxID=2771012 RepID=UPI00168B21F8|nr:glycosyltransferase family 4 protein [Wenzhouxiangella sp. AB-CW3]QOC22029.1 glycosyltransferase family 4 protein [Wenzhouxiangella sp. AB-CW3]